MGALSGYTQNPLGRAGRVAPSDTYNISPTRVLLLSATMSQSHVLAQAEESLKTHNSFSGVQMLRLGINANKTVLNENAVA
jgi:hypothetical protein